MAELWFKLYKYLPNSCNNIYSSMYPFHILTKLFGLAPYDMDSVANKRVFAISKFAIGKYVIQMALYGAFFGYNIWAAVTDRSMATLIETLQFLQSTIANCLSLIEMILCVLMTRNIIKMFEILDEVDYCLFKMSILVDYKDAFLKSIISCSLIVIVFIPIIILFYWTNDYVGNEFLRFLMVLIQYGPYMVNIIVELQYVVFMWLVQQRYKLLNLHLLKLLAECEDIDWLLEQTPIFSTKTVQATAVTPLALPPPKEKLFFLTASSPPSKKIIDEEEPVIIVDNVASLHIKLSDTAQLINRTFRIQLLFMITICFIGIVTALFLAAVQFSLSSKTESPDAFTAWACMNALEIVALVYITCSTCEEANRCPRILHRIRNNTNNIMLQDTIEVYSLQMYHNRLQFNVCGLFPLDYTLLYSIVAGVTTYLVILIQFNSTDSKPNNQTNQSTTTMATI